MTKFVLGILLVLSIFLIYTFFLATKSTDFFQKEELSVIVVAFGEKDENGQWEGEVAPYMQKLKNPQEVSRSVPMCKYALNGKLFDKNVLVVVAGMGKVNMTACIKDVLDYRDGDIREIILSGIAGMSPMRGGLVDQNGSVRNDEPVMVGDVCINSVAVDFDLQRYSADSANTKSPNPLFWPSDALFSAKEMRAKTKLAKELERASKNVNFPQVPKQVEEVNLKYHKISRKPKVWGLGECLEVSGDLFWHDIRSDSIARLLAYEMLGKINSQVKKESVVIATSMEAVPAGVIVSRWNDLHGKNIDFAYVRSASNFDHVWLDENGFPAEDGSKSLEGFGAGYEYAIQIQALPVLKMFEMRK